MLNNKISIFCALRSQNFQILKFGVLKFQNCKHYLSIILTAVSTTVLETRKNALLSFLHLFLVDLRNIVAISVILATTTAECPSGFVLNPGTISGTGQLGYHKNIESIDDCSQLCKAEEYCCAFEYSDSRKRCYINVDCNPTKGVYKDYKYCTKDSGNNINNF